MKNKKAATGNAGLARKLGRDLFEIGSAKRRKIEGRNDGYGWDHLSATQQAAWHAFGEHVRKMLAAKTPREK